MKNLIPRSLIAILLLSSAIIANNISPDPEHRRLGFEGGEHTLLGDGVTILFPQQQSDDSYEYLPQLGNHVDFAPWLFAAQLSYQLTYGNIVAMPDIFANTSHAIADGVNEKDQQERFKSSFATFYNNSKSHIKSLNGVLGVINEEIALIKKALADGGQPSEDYEKAGLSFTEKYIWYDPMMLEILLTCITDHFAGFDDCAWTAYHAGHQVALATALQAHHEENPATKSKLLVLAYAMNGYACHYLSDRFAAGVRQEKLAFAIRCKS